MEAVLDVSEVRSIILNNRDKTNHELNKLFPNVSVKKFSSNRIQLEKKGFVEKINKTYSTISECDDDELTRIVKNNLHLSSKELHELYPKVTHNKFTWIRFKLFPDEYQKTVLENKLKKSLKINKKEFGSYQSKKNNKKDKDKKKVEIREKVAEYMQGLKGLTLFLPHIECLCVKEVVKLNNNLSFIGVDKSDNVIKGMTACAKLNNLDLTPIKGELNDVVRNYSADTFVSMNLDYCGIMPNQASSFNYVIKNDLIVKGGYLFLTFKNVVRNYKGVYAVIFKELMKMNIQSETGLTDSEFANDNFLKLIIGDKFTIVDKQPYQTGSPMIFYVLQRIR